MLTAINSRLEAGEKVGDIERQQHYITLDLAPPISIYYFDALRVANFGRFARG